MCKSPLQAPCVSLPMQTHRQQCCDISQQFNYLFFHHVGLTQEGIILLNVSISVETSKNISTNNFD